MTRYTEDKSALNGIPYSKIVKDVLKIHLTIKEKEAVLEQERDIGSASPSLNMGRKRRNTITVSENANKRNIHPLRLAFTSPPPEHDIQKDAGTTGASSSKFASWSSAESSPTLPPCWTPNKGAKGMEPTPSEQSFHIGHARPAFKKSEEPDGPSKMFPGLGRLDATQTENTDLSPSAFEKEGHHQDKNIDENKVCGLLLLLPADVHRQDSHISGNSVKRPPREQKVEMCSEKTEREGGEKSLFSRTKSLGGSTVHSARKGESLFSARSDDFRDFEVEWEAILTGLTSCQKSLDLVSKTFARRATALRDYLEELMRSLESLETEKSENLMSISQLLREVQMTKEELSEKSLLVCKLETETKTLRQAVHMSEVKVQSLESTASDAREQTHRLRDAHASLVKTNELLEAKICLLQEFKHKNTAASQALEKKFSMLTNTTQALHEEMAAFDRGQKAMQREIASKDDSILQLENVQKHLEERNQYLEEQSQESMDYSKRLEADNKRLNELLVIVRTDLAEIQAQSADKDRIISGDTQLVSELHRELSQQKLIIDEMRKEGEKNAAGHELSESELMMQVKSLKSQILSAQQKSDERIQEIAEQLYHQYSKKHEVKVSQLRRNYETKIAESLTETKKLQKKVEHLESQLKMELKEKEYLLSVLDKEKVHVL